MKIENRFGMLLSLLALISIVNCDTCFLEVKEPKYGNDVFTRRGLSEEQADKALVKYIANRTVMIKASCKVVDYKGRIIRKAKEQRFGSGTIIKSTDSLSLVQTAYHVVEPYSKYYFSAKYGLVQVVCSNKFSIETRWPDNTIRNYYIRKTIHKRNFIYLSF